MKRSHLLGLALVPVLLGGATVSAGGDAPGCGLPRIYDPEIRASFERFERTQSAGAQFVCGLYVVGADLTFPDR
jgi:hypothetical protein